MLVLRILIAAFVIGYVVWFVSNRILGKNLILSRVMLISLLITGLIYSLLAVLSYLLEGG